MHPATSNTPNHPFQTDRRWRQCKPVPLVHAYNSVWSDAHSSDVDGNDFNANIFKQPPLLPIPNRLETSKDKLCSFCASLRLKPEDFVVRPGPPVRRYSTKDRTFGLIRDVRTKADHCPLCRLVLKSLGPNLLDEEDGVPIEATFSWDTEGIVPDPRASDETLPIVRQICIDVQKEGGGDCNQDIPLALMIRILANDAPTEEKSLLPRIIKEQIDFGMVRRWIDVCKKLHISTCGGVHPDLTSDGAVDIVQEIPSLRMIDVIDQRITLAPRQCVYVALSYVWGRIDPQRILRTLKSNIADLEEPNSLQKPEFYDKIPITIRDAMLVVKELHMRYLWVDSLCIIQDDDGEGGSKMEAISKMAYVYGAASLTITAASGIDANAGLPGVRPGADRSQPIEKIGPGLRLAVVQKHQDHQGQSVYYTRGWTYQEGYFTRRNLLFIGGQVVYSCASTESCREDEVLETKHAMVSRASDISEHRSKDDIGKLEEIITSYTCRSLTYDSDIYHAIAATLTVFKRVINADLCHGIPDVFFDWFVLWQPGGMHKRRSIAPSWSWSGWIGTALPRIWQNFTRSITRIRKVQKKRTWIIWYQRKAHDTHECTRVNTVKTSGDDAAATKRMQKLFPELNCSLQLPTPRKLIGAPVYVEDTYYPRRGSGFLQFWTISVLFDLDKPADDDERPDELEIGRAEAIANIYGRDGWHVGQIIVQDDWFEANVPGRHEFIVICEGRTEPLETWRSEDKEVDWKYRVMLITWQGDGQWAERVAVGAIEKEDLNEALESGPVWKEIVLG